LPNRYQVSADSHKHEQAFFGEARANHPPPNSALLSSPMSILQTGFNLELTASLWSVSQKHSQGLMCSEKMAQPQTHVRMVRDVFMGVN